MARSSSFGRLVLAALWMAKALAQPQASVTGTVTDSVTGLPILRAHVNLRAGEKSFGAFSDAEGKFTIRGLTPGEYFVSAESARFVPRRSTSNPVSLKAGDANDAIEVKLTPMGAIVGRILDAEGEPVQGVHVLAQGVGQAGDATTDDKGHYRIGGLAPGRYRVEAWKDWRNTPPEIRTDGSKEIRYAPTYYPGTLSSKEATRVAVQPGGESGGIDVQLIGRPIVKVSGKVVSVPPGANAVFVEGGQAGMVRAAKDDGSFAIWGLNPGKVTLTARVVGLTGRDLQSAPVELEIGTENVENIELRLVPAFDVSGSLRFEDERARTPKTGDEGPGKNMKARISLEPLRSGNSVTVEIGDDQSFQLEHVQPGQYRAEIGLGNNAYVKSMRLGSQDVEGNVIDLRYGASGALTLVVSADTCEISGTVSDAKGPMAGAMVGLLPQRNGLSSGAVTNDAGKYSITGLPPGKYRLRAGNESEMELMTAPGIEPEDDEDSFVTVELRAGDKITLDLKASALER